MVKSENNYACNLTVIGARLIYNLFFHLILLFLPLRLLWRARKNPAYLGHWRERFGFYKTAKLHESIWVHAVSVGESLCAIPLIKMLKEKYPTTPIVVTSMTPTGAQSIQKALGKEIQQFFVPYDFPFAVKRFLQEVNPKILIIMETELWPNILHYCAKRKIPVVLANACLSERSFHRYKKCISCAKHMLAGVRLILAQSKQDAYKFLQIGFDPEKLSINGSMKFDIIIPDDLGTNAQKLRSKYAIGHDRPVFIAASTHEGEEEIILDAYKKTIARIPNLLLILAPRHPERFAKVAKLCADAKLQSVKFSDNNAINAKTNVLLVDVIGQLLPFYALSDVAFVGGSLDNNTGGHNILEPAALGIPIITGPNIFNLRETSELMLNAGAMLKIKTSDELASSAIELLLNPKQRSVISSAAKSVLQKNKGATQRIFEEITNILQ